MTTIALRKDTYDLLTHVKEDIEAATYDEAVRVLVLRTKKPTHSLFGRLKPVKSTFVREKVDRIS